MINHHWTRALCNQYGLKDHRPSEPILLGPLVGRKGVEAEARRGGTLPILGGTAFLLYAGYAGRRWSPPPDLNRGPADFSGCIGFIRKHSTVSRSSQSELGGDSPWISRLYINLFTEGAGRAPGPGSPRRRRKRFLAILAALLGLPSSVASIPVPPSKDITRRTRSSS